MATACTQMATPFVLFVTPGKAETTLFTITHLPPMYTEWIQEDFPDDCLNEESVNEYVKNTESMPMENSYASIIETVLEDLLE
jgi:hypothetical protein